MLKGSKDTARVNADPQRREEFVMKERLHQKQKTENRNSFVMPQYETL